jgi:Tuberculosis necrotizing toxin
VTTPQGFTYANSPQQTPLNVSTIGPIADPRASTPQTQIAQGVTDGMIGEVIGAPVAMAVGAGFRGASVTAQSVREYFATTGVRVSDDVATRVANNFGREGDRFTQAAEEMSRANNAGWQLPNGRTWYPSGNGAVPGTEFQTTLPVGTRLDRFGSISNNTDFLAPAGTPFGQRALPATAEAQPLVQLEVVRPLPVQQSNVMPWFNQPGMGVQFQTTTGSTGYTVRQLIEQGYLRVVR